MATNLGEKIQKLRKEKALTLQQLADKTGSSKSYIWELENRTPPRPSADKLSKIASHLGVTIEFLFDDEDSVSEDSATDEMFFRKYRQMTPDVKKKIRRMIEVWDE
jgi:transcriptional regulator with XRE-family HTH domain